MLLLQNRDYPIPAYLIAIAVTNYAVYEDRADLGNGDSLDILHYVFPEDFDRSQRNTPIIPEMIELYNELFGTYPFSEEKYGHAQFGWGGGMEHQTMSFMGGPIFGPHQSMMPHFEVHLSTISIKMSRVSISVLIYTILVVCHWYLLLLLLK